MSVQNMTSNSGNAVANQFIVHGESGVIYFQSYNSIIAFVPNDGGKTQIGTDWAYSVTTGKYRNDFLNEDKKDLYTEMSRLANLFAREFRILRLMGSHRQDKGVGFFLTEIALHFYFELQGGAIMEYIFFYFFQPCITIMNSFLNMLSMAIIMN